jgi:predicted TIM-barrel fold metal-dependent hydrolase
MIYDMHVHVFGTEARNDNRLQLNRTGQWFARSMTRAWRRGRQDVLPTDRALVDQILAWVDDSVVDRVVLLALDWVHRSDGARDVARTRVACGNDFVHAASCRSPKALFGASVHPYRPDALQELERVVGLGACLIKWIPSAQRIRLDHPRCFPFYDRLARLRVPLLCHTGVEHVLSGGPVTYNDPRRLRAALDRGVTVIAAHLGMRMTIFEPNHNRHWLGLLEDYPHLFGDVSALAVPWRAAMLRRLITREAVRDRMVYGSDFPHTAWPSALCMQLGLRKARRLAGLTNPIDRSYATTRALGLEESVFARAQELLNVA